MKKLALILYIICTFFTNISALKMTVENRSFMTANVVGVSKTGRHKVHITVAPRAKDDDSTLFGVSLGRVEITLPDGRIYNIQIDRDGSKWYLIVENTTIGYKYARVYRLYKGDSPQEFITTWNEIH